MPITTTNMGLTSWTLPNDFFNHTQLSANWSALDAHDHSAGKGVQISSTGLAAGAVGTTQLQNTSVTNAKLTSPTTGVYRTLASGSMMTGSGSGGPSNVTYLFAQAGYPGTSGSPSTVPQLVDGGSLITAVQPILIPVFAADHLVNALTTKLRLRVMTACNSLAPSPATFSVALAAVTFSGGGVPAIFKGTTVTSMSPTITAGTSVVTTGADVSLPSDGYYLMATTITGTMPVNSFVGLWFNLQAHNV